MVPIVLLNLITAVLVEVAISAAAKDQEHQRAIEQDEWRRTCRELQDLFMALMSEHRPIVNSITSREVPVNESSPSSAESKQSVVNTTMIVLNRIKRTLTSTDEDRLGDEDDPKLCLAEEDPTFLLKKAHVEKAVESTTKRGEKIRERLNLLFAEPAGTKRGIQRLLEVWELIDVNRDGDLTLEEFTEGLAFLSGQIRTHSAETFVMLRLLRELSEAKEERAEATDLDGKNRADANRRLDEVTADVHNLRMEVRSELGQLRKEWAKLNRDATTPRKFSPCASDGSRSPKCNCEDPQVYPTTVVHEVPDLKSLMMDVNSLREDIAGLRMQLAKSPASQSTRQRSRPIAMPASVFPHPRTLPEEPWDNHESL